ncbi:hypothetical protein Pint_07082 [Pistacia integerrima]|uniref:Uncharacterized protein n=1 Tax=Pistacia integerrima TaxID=434235 RepID=A0ACC0XVB3_9ROSI|nr:hypothetical protein Pint_07082 [Pistacia integerrima]
MASKIDQMALQRQIWPTLPDPSQLLATQGVAMLSHRPGLTNHFQRKPVTKMANKATSSSEFQQ